MRDPLWNNTRTVTPDNAPARDLDPAEVDPSARLWRLSGFDDNGNVIEFEFAGPACDSASIAFRPTILIGRDQERADFYIADRTISRHHAVLRLDYANGLTVMDMGSSNGTFVDGERVESGFQQMKVGSELRLGEVTLKVSYVR